MTRYVFQSYPARAIATFACPKCGKKARKRTFKAECTVNPFNRRADGMPRSADEVRQQSRDQARTQRDEFLRAPLCVSCEDELSYTELAVLHQRRRGADAA